MITQRPGVYGCYPPFVGGDKNVLFVYSEGAFNSAWQHSGKLLDLLRSRGNLVYTEYDLKGRYDHDKVYNDVRATVEDWLVVSRGGSNRRVVCVGSSMGAINTFRLATDNLYGNPERGIIVADPMLTANAMPKDAYRGASVLTKMHPGKFWNKLLNPLIQKLIPGRSEDIWEEGVEADVRANLACMRSTSPAAYLDFARAILAATPPDSSKCRGMKVAALWSETDPTLNATAAKEDLRNATVEAELEAWMVPGAQHVTFSEQPSVWKDAFSAAIDYVLTD